MRVFTIDESLDQEEIDDGLSVEVEKDGREWVYIHIADPSVVVGCNSPLDLIARQRATSIYLPDRPPIFMFPPPVVQLFSLRGVDALGRKGTERVNESITFAAAICPTTGKLLEYKIAPSFIKRIRHYDYNTVDAMFSQKLPSHAATEDREMEKRLRRLLELANVRRKHRHEVCGAISIHLPRPEIQVFSGGEDIRVRALVDWDSASRYMVSEFMILAGQIAATYAAQNKIPIPFRSQLPSGSISPQYPTSSQQFGVTGFTIGPSINGSKSNYIYNGSQHNIMNVTHLGKTSPINVNNHCDSHNKENKADEKENPTVEKETNLDQLEYDYYQRVMDNWERLKGMMPSMTCTYSLPHSSLGLDAYTQVTSPIRKYSNLLVHYQLKAALNGHPLPFQESDIILIIQQIQKREQLAANLENMSKRFWILHYLAKQKETNSQTVWKGLILSYQGSTTATVLLLDFGLKVSANVPRTTKPGQLMHFCIYELDPTNDHLKLQFIEPKT